MELDAVTVREALNNFEDLFATVNSVAKKRLLKLSIARISIVRLTNRNALQQDLQLSIKMRIPGIIETSEKVEGEKDQRAESFGSFSTKIVVRHSKPYRSNGFTFVSPDFGSVSGQEGTLVRKTQTLGTSVLVPHRNFQKSERISARLRSNSKLTRAAIARDLGVTRPMITYCQRLLQLPR